MFVIMHINVFVINLGLQVDGIMKSRILYFVAGDGQHGAIHDISPLFFNPIVCLQRPHGTVLGTPVVCITHINLSKLLVIYRSHFPHLQNGTTVYLQ